MFNCLALAWFKDDEVSRTVVLQQDIWRPFDHHAFEGRCDALGRRRDFERLRRHGGGDGIGVLQQFDALGAGVLDFGGYTRGAWVCTSCSRWLAKPNDGDTDRPTNKCYLDGNCHGGKGYEIAVK